MSNDNQQNGEGSKGEACTARIMPRADEDKRRREYRKYQQARAAGP